MKKRPIGALAIRRHLVSVYITEGYEAARPLAVKYGYRPKYLNQMARQMVGHYRTLFYRNSKFVEFESYRFDPRFIVRTTNEAYPQAPHRPQAGIQDCQA